jgi:hypothetical protein
VRPCRGYSTRRFPLSRQHPTPQWLLMKRGEVTWRACSASSLYFWMMGPNSCAQASQSVEVLVMYISSLVGDVLSGPTSCHEGLYVNLAIGYCRRGLLRGRFLPPGFRIGKFFSPIRRFTSRLGGPDRILNEAGQWCMARRTSRRSRRNIVQRAAQTLTRSWHFQDIFQGILGVIRAKYR